MTPTFVRGATVSITVNFLDAQGEPNNPDGATLTLEFPIAGGLRDTATVALVRDGTDWTYDWDSSVAEPGRVYLHAVTDGLAPFSAIDEQFKLSANSANTGA